MENEALDILRSIPAFATHEPKNLHAISGLTNRNYRFEIDGEAYILRVSKQNVSRLGIDRHLEREILHAVAAQGIGAEVIAYLLPEGHMITRVINGGHWTGEAFRRPENLKLVVDTVKQLHSLPPVEAVFSPFRRVDSYTRHAAELGVTLPGGFDRLTEHMAQIEAEQQADPSNWYGLCHNDLYHVNFLYDGKVRLIDWEFAGMGDIYYDLATLTFAYESDGPMPEKEENLLLKYYFGEVTPTNQKRLEGMKFMVLFFTAMWGVLQHGMISSSIIPPYEGFDTLQYAAYIFDQMQEMIR